ncbi:phosphoesterase [Chthoniobacter flavus Ellin428]|uniref:Phosphoesterase n=1 Tax=Chthoniobacter flavus Ellin428 TaxID=497964 RepID=B4D364_9BACT|nr:alkaline phosphatase family protein [Chthoniobacter flavus]EDY19175.1 phosphoesterase [Chthoniobacter flavus Ellin428]TCO88021.1 phosphatidylinositol-3-phosphate phosphatase /acid phosphatase [Chthoniobacter flavus]
MHLPLRRFLPLLCSASIATVALPASVHAGDAPPALDWPKTAPVYDHVVIVLEENKDYEQIINNAWTPYISSVLCKEGAVFTQMFGEEHSSEGNYFWLFSGNNHRIGFYDQMPQHLLKAPNLGEQLLKNGLTFMGYSENLPAVDSTVVVWPPKPDRALYARKHVPWVSFSNLSNGTSLPFTQFPKDAAGFGNLPTVSFVIPNLINDMHDGAPKDSVPAGDTWLKENIDAYYQWARKHNSLLVLTFDENDNRGHYQGLTNPGVSLDGPDAEFRHSLQNRIPTIFAGAHIKAGEYPEGKGITHVNLLRTFEAMYGLGKSGDQQPNALGIGITNDYVVTDVFQ